MAVGITNMLHTQHTQIKPQTRKAFDIKTQKESIEKKNFEQTQTHTMLYIDTKKRDTKLNKQTQFSDIKYYWNKNETRSQRVENKYIVDAGYE